ncbi:MAG: pyridoxamine 5'-phosphate oxidase [Candidatus Cyclonatronum sp.]|uniref:pyridoxamine 5'-phosphate oxidase n=1 Tax=Cyclonatronum sp. TaxID=3024185 RepID=UPI0025C45716|nr:pyridoxamine 5'-phosphate oxidase [Cyclonatronum sp.]MCH8485518.1 pyridoxamine 5'-phosphate oxidase [Cyclonatronum sp.]
MLNPIKSWFSKRDVQTWRTAVAAMRREYTGEPLTEEAAGANPLELFERWYAEAAEQSLFDANAFVLSTVSENRPHARVVLLKGFDERGLVFYTNYESDKARQIDANPEVALTFNWPESFRQLRIEGTASRISGAESDAYFNARPAESNLSAVISPQSRPVESRQWLEEKQEALKTELQVSGKPLERPANWGGYRIMPKYWEFWQGRTGRLHDRIAFIPDASRPNTWKTQRLAP